jgi:hypothetical protein
MNTCEGLRSKDLRIMKALEVKTPEMKTWEGLGGGDPHAEMTLEAEDPKVKTSAPRRDRDEGSYNWALETHLRAKKTSEAKASRIQTYAS